MSNAANVVEVMPPETPDYSDKMHIPFWYKVKSICQCKLSLEECLLQNSKADGIRCPDFYNNHTPRQEAARRNTVDLMKQKVRICHAAINDMDKAKKILDKSTSYGCVGCGCLLGAAFIMFMAGCGLMIFKWSCDFLLWVAGKF